MEASQRLSILPERERRGSRARCILLTEGPREMVAEQLTKIVEPYAIVRPTNIWMPNGFASPGEAKLGETQGFLSAEQREAVTSWWLARRAGANTPNWDIAATAAINGSPGLVLVEAKAHSDEIKIDGKGLAGQRDNHARIEQAIKEAARKLNTITAGWNLSADVRYQLANRFAWTWKIASLGIPVILVYLGFLRADEMSDQGAPFADATAWETMMQSHCRGLVPAAAWNKPLSIHGIPMRALIRSCFVGLA